MGFKAVPRKLRLRRIIMLPRPKKKRQNFLEQLGLGCGRETARDNGGARRSQILVKHSAGSPGVFSHRLVRILNRDLIRRLNRPLNQPRRTRGICRRISGCAVLGSVAFGHVCHTTLGPDCLKTCKPVCTRENSETKLQMLHISARRARLQRCRKLR
jgi:hypothetical protein